MRALRAHAYGPPESLQLEEIADPALREGEVRLEVKACGVNFADALFTAGTYQVKPEPPFTPGFEVAGQVVESRDPRWPAGSRVVATAGAGGYATHAVVPGSTVHALPEGMPFEDAAAMTITYQTGWFGLHRRAGLRAGDWLLVHAAAGGVGSAAVQLGKAAGARVIATAGGAEKVQLARSLGADLAVDYRSEDFVEVVKAATQGRGADVIYDPVGGDVFDKSTRCIAFEGRIVVVGFASGRVPQARANHLLVKNYAVVGLHWWLYLDRDPAAVAACQRELNALYGRGLLKPLVSERVSLADAPAALARVAGGKTIGKIVIAP
jgi:NADPH2:quinone reductase